MQEGTIQKLEYTDFEKLVIRSSIEHFKLYMPWEEIGKDKLSSPALLGTDISKKFVDKWAYCMNEIFPLDQIDPNRPEIISKLAQFVEPIKGLIDRERADVLYKKYHPLLEIFYSQKDKKGLFMFHSMMDVAMSEEFLNSANEFAKKENENFEDVWLLKTKVLLFFCLLTQSRLKSKGIIKH